MNAVELMLVLLLLRVVVPVGLLLLVGEMAQRGERAARRLTLGRL